MPLIQLRFIEKNIRNDIIDNLEYSQLTKGNSSKDHNARLFSWLNDYCVKRTLPSIHRSQKEGV